MGVPKVILVARIMEPKRYPHPNSGAPDDVTLCGKRNFAGVIMLTRKEEHILDYSTWAQSNHKSLKWRNIPSCSQRDAS